MSLGAKPSPDSRPVNIGRSRAAVLAIFVVSGAAGLMYEVVWARQLVLVFGNTTQAVSTILTGFFGGMAVGSALGGRIGDRVRRPLLLYGVLELSLVVVVLATPTTFGLLHEAYRGAFLSLEGNPPGLALVRFGLALAALSPATVLMGATLPILTRYLSRDPSELSGSFGKLYAANTIGAIVGTILAGFVLIELLGLTGTLVAAAACSGTAGLVAVLLDRRRPPLPIAQATQVDSGPFDAPERPRVRLAVALAFASGLTSLGYQVLWTRLLASGTGNSTYVFTTILAVFLIGLALGALAYSVLRSRIRDVVALLSLGQICVALLVTIGMATVIGRQVAGVPSLATHFDSLTNLIGPVAGVVLPATFVMGLTFPAASALVVDPSGRVATNSGMLLAANTLGAIVATFLIPFVVIPAVGSPLAVGLLGVVNASIGISLAVRGGMVRPLPRVVSSAGGTVIVALVVASIATGQVFIDPSVARIRSNGGQIGGSAEDEIASVQAGQVGGTKQLWVTGTSMTVLTVDAKLMPILPLILRPESRTELTIAFGMGTAYRSALRAGLRSEAVELVPSVPSMFGFFYSDAGAVLSDPNGHLIIADGRNHVELTDRTYDIVIVDPPPPIESSGVSVISSLEFYRASKARLNPGGVMMQWVPFGQTLDEFKAHVRTFRDVFSNVIVAHGPAAWGFYLLGSDEPIAFAEASIHAVLIRPGVLEDLSSASDSPRHSADGWATLIPGLVSLSGDQVAEFVGTGPRITDDRPLPEYFLLRHTFGAPSPQLSLDLVKAP